MKKNLVLSSLVAVTTLAAPCIHAQNHAVAPNNVNADQDAAGDIDHVDTAAVKQQWIASQKEAAARIATPVNILSRIQSMDHSSKDAKIETVKLAEENIADLQSCLKKNLDSNDIQTAACSMFLAGAYHLTPMASDLVDHITFQDTNHYGKSDALWYWGQYPAAEALVELGFPAVSAVVDELAESKDKKQRLLCLWVLVRTSGQEDKGFARLFIQRELDDKSDGADKLTAAQKKNLADALVSLSKNEQESFE